MVDCFVLFADFEIQCVYTSEGRAKGAVEQLTKMGHKGVHYKRTPLR